MTKAKRDMLQRQKIMEIMNYFEKYKLNSNKDIAIEKLKRDITEIFQLEVQDINNSNNVNKLTIEFTNLLKEGDGASINFSPNDNTGEIPIKFHIPILCMKLDSDDKDIRKEKCKKIIEGIFHEIRHYKQHLMTQDDKSSKNALIFAKDLALRKYLAQNWYRENYKEYAMENDARYAGYSRYLEIMGNKDPQILNLKAIEKGMFENCEYKISRGKHYIYNSMERDKLTSILLDNIICKRKMIKILSKYPILKKEYNSDGTKKTAKELIQNMKEEEQSAKGQKLKELQEMYYELIYKQFEQSTDEEIEATISNIESNELRKTIQNMSEYFKNEKARKIKASIEMAKAQENEKTEGFILPSNSGAGVIQVKEKNTKLSFDEFMKTIKPELLKKKFSIPYKDQIYEVDAEKFVKNNFLEFIPQEGTVTLKSGKEISAKQFIETHILTLKELKFDYPPELILKDVLKSESPWKIQEEVQRKIENEYDNKQEVINEIDKKILQQNKEKNINQTNDRDDEER